MCDIETPANNSAIVFVNTSQLLKNGCKMTNSSKNVV